MSDMPSNMPAERMWTVSDDQRSVRMQIPTLCLAGWPGSLDVHLDFDTEMVDDILQRLTVRRSKMLPPPLRN